MVNIVRKDMLEGIGPFNPLACISLQCGLKQINVIQNNCEKKIIYHIFKSTFRYVMILQTR